MEDVKFPTSQPLKPYIMPLIPATLSTTRNHMLCHKQKNSTALQLQTISNKQFRVHADPSVKILPYKKIVLFSQLNFTSSIVFNSCPWLFINIWATNGIKAENN
jgi:hypothetical protein